MPWKRDGRWDCYLANFGVLLIKICIAMALGVMGNSCGIDGMIRRRKNGLERYLFVRWPSPSVQNERLQITRMRITLSTVDVVPVVKRVLARS